jgi:hypothetical protein
LQPIDDQPQPKGALHLRIQQRDLGVLAPATEPSIHVLSAAQTSAVLSPPRRRCVRRCAPLW